MQSDFSCHTDHTLIGQAELHPFIMIVVWLGQSWSLCFGSSSDATSVTLLLASGDLAGRLAVVPMSQEAKGLDAGPRLAEKLVGCGDNRTAAIVSRIALEEKAHVAVGKSPTPPFWHTFPLVLVVISSSAHWSPSAWWLVGLCRHCCLSQ